MKVTKSNNICRKKAKSLKHEKIKQNGWKSPKQVKIAETSENPRNESKTLEHVKIAQNDWKSL